MSSSEDSSKQYNKLKGKVNYSEWYKRFCGFVIAKNWGVFTNGELTVSTGKESEAFIWLLNNIADEAMQPFSVTATVQENLKLLNNAYGHGRLNPTSHQRYILDNIDFPVQKDPSQVFLWLDKQFEVLVSCGGMVTQDLLQRAILEGLTKSLNPKSVFDTGDFWFIIRGQLKLEREDWDYELIKSSIYDFWDAHRNPLIAIDQSSFNSNKKLVNPTSCAVKGDSTEKKRCEYCKKYRKKLSVGHDTSQCFFGDRPGWKKSVEVGNSNNVEGTNKVDDEPYSSYSPIFHDSGSSPTSFFRDQPKKFIAKAGTVGTAGLGQKPTCTRGSGEIQVGKMTLKDVVHAPTFKHNLLSGIQVMKEGYQQLIQDDTKTDPTNDRNQPLVVDHVCCKQ